MRKLVYYVATSVDGYIADTTGDFSAFPNDPATLQTLFARYPETCPAQAREALGITAQPHRFDTVLMGYQTYLPGAQIGLTVGAYPHLRQIVVTHRDLNASGLETISGDITDAVATLKQQDGKDIWLCGGSEIAAQLVDLIDEIQIKVNPVLLGHGIPLLPFTGIPRTLDLTKAEPLPGGVQLLTYTNPAHHASGA